MKEEAAKKILFDIDDIANEVNLTYMLYGGTCLGAVREGKFIDIDLDVDCCCLHEEFIEVYRDLHKLFKLNDFEVELMDHRHDRDWSGMPYGFKLRKYGVNSDFFSMFNLGDKRYVPSHKGQFMLVHKAEHIERLACIKFYGKMFMVPFDTHGFLTDKYGNWETPHTEFNNICAKTCRKEVQNGNDFWWI